MTVSKAPQLNTQKRSRNSGLASALSMSSREIAKLVGSRTDSVKRTIERLATAKTNPENGAVTPAVIELPPMVEVKNHLGQRVSEYVFSGEKGKRDSIIVVAQLSPEFTAQLVDRWMELEAKQVALDEAHVARQSARLEAPMLADAVKFSREAEGKETEFFHYSNEYDLINRIVLGCSASQFRKAHGLRAGDAIRDKLLPAQIKAIDHLQRHNATMIEMGISRSERKDRLQQLFSTRHLPAINGEAGRLCA